MFKYAFKGIAVIALSIYLVNSLAKPANQATPPQLPSNAAFSYALYQALPSKNDNFAISPFSLRQCLALVYMGADANIQEKMDAVLNYHLTDSKLVDALNLEYKLLQQSINHPIKTTPYNQANDNKAIINNPPNQSTTSKNKLLINNSAWINNQHAFNKKYQTLIQSLNNTSLNSFNAHQADQSAQIINQWIYDHTQGMITKVIEPQNITPAAEAFLIDTLYLKATWETPFKKENTRNEPFYETPKQPVLTSMMHNGDIDLPYYSDDNFQSIMLPYNNSDLSMIILLPKNRTTTLASIRSTIPSISKLATSFKTTHFKIDLSLPSFTIQSKWKNLLNTFTTMAQLPSNPPINQMIDAPPSSIRLTDIIQKCKITMNESGTKAAAATVARMAAGATPGNAIPVPRIVFNANHPFIFVVYDRTSNNILFLGEVNQAPSST